MVVVTNDGSFRPVRRDDSSKTRTDPRAENPDDNFSNQARGDEHGSSRQH
jgi:hypothetical protein